MTREQAIELGRRAVACKAWKWMPGMVDFDGLRILSVHGDGFVVASYDDEGVPPGYYSPAEIGKHAPDLRDPATIGCVLYLLGRLFGEKTFGEPMNTIRFGSGLTFAEALVAALEGAP